MRDNVFTHIGLVGKFGERTISSSISQVLKILDQRGIVYTLDADTVPKSLIHQPYTKPLLDWSPEIDLCIVIGGDGTFLHAGRSLLHKGIPLLGINAGRLGFLADLPTNQLDTQLNAILSGQYYLEQRQTLAVEVIAHQEVRARFNAINDAVIHKRTMARMVELDAYTRGELLCHYRADGLILSTPTGSTAYALSAGGPILEPNMDALIIAPICPHTLTHRPVVVGPDSEIEVVLHPFTHDTQLTIDGQEELLLNTDDRIFIRHASALRVLHPADYQFQRRLREKLNWGVTPEQIQDNPHA